MKNTTILYLRAYAHFLSQKEKKSHRLTLPVLHFRIGWSNLGDDELLALSSAIQVKKKLEELW